MKRAEDNALRLWIAVRKIVEEKEKEAMKRVGEKSGKVEERPEKR